MYNVLNYQFRERSLALREAFSILYMLSETRVLHLLLFVSGTINCMGVTINYYVYMTQPPHMHMHTHIYNIYILNLVV